MVLWEGVWGLGFWAGVFERGIRGVGICIYMVEGDESMMGGSVVYGGFAVESVARHRVSTYAVL